MRFSTRGISRLEHEEVLEGLEVNIEPHRSKPYKVLRICFVTVNANEVKQKLLLEGINIRGAYNNIVDADRIVTNVTIKDAPVRVIR